MQKGWIKSIFFHSGDEYFQSIINAIHQAKKTIQIEAYIFAIDPVTNEIFKALGMAAQRGVRVQVLADGFGSYYWADELRDRSIKEKIECRIYHPLPRSIKWFRYFSFIHFLRIAKMIRKLNRRNHRKTTIIDGDKLWIGSMNMTQEHSENVMGAKVWRDSSVYLEGLDVKLAELAFDHAWNDAGKEKLFKKILNLPRMKKTAIPFDNIRINFSQKLRFQLYRDLIRRINTSQTRILVTSAYFLPKRSFLRALKNAQRRGVLVQILTPGPSDVPLVKMASYNILKWLTKKNVEIFEYQNRILHAKYIIIDNWASLGSANLNHRSFIHDLEIEAVITELHDVNTLNHQFQLDLQSSRRISLLDLKNMPWVYRFISRIAFSIRYML